MSEKWTYKESCSTDLSPTAIFTPRIHQSATASATPGAVGGCTRGAVGRVGPEGYYPGTPQDHPRTHI